jgi:hypothetical protein
MAAEKKMANRGDGKRAHTDTRYLLNNTRILSRCLECDGKEIVGHSAMSNSPLRRGNDDRHN